MIPTLKRLAIGFPVDWSHRRGFTLPAERFELGPYYVDWDPGEGVFGEDWTKGRHDACGVLCDTAAYHPIRIAQYGLHLHAHYLRTGDVEARERFMAQAEWLRDHHRRCGFVEGLYVFDFPWSKYGAYKTWTSAMAQGEAISALLRADRLNPGCGFYDAALAVAEPFKYRIEEGGVVWQDGSAAFFEEIANAHAPHILNGCIFAFWGLWELHQRRGELWVAVLLERVRETLLRWLPLYDTGWWSRYSLMQTSDGRPHIATLKYHAFHIAQLHVLAAMLGEPRFERIASRWEGYVEDRTARRRVVVDAAMSLYRRATTRDTVAGGSHAVTA